MAQRFAGEITLARLLEFNAESRFYGKVYERRDRYFSKVSSTGTRSIKDEKYELTLASRPRKRLHRQMLNLEASLLGSQKSIDLLLKLESVVFKREHASLYKYYQEMFTELSPNLVVSTLPHHAYEAPPLLVASDLGIPTAAWVTSWDNLTSKPAYRTKFDNYFVWSEKMTRELKCYYGEAAGSNVEVVGVPHFDWYRKSKFVCDREFFCHAIGFDPLRPIVYYATATPHLAPSEHLVVRKLYDELQTWPVAVRPQLLVRLHPADGGGRFEEWPTAPDLTFQRPGRDGEGRMERYCPSFQENVAFVSGLYHAGVVVNLASTITLDAAILDRPVINIAYDGDPACNHQEMIDYYYTMYDHYVTVVESGAVRLARNHESLMDHIRTYLDDPTLERVERRVLSELWCGEVDGNSGSRMAASLIKAAHLD